MAKYIYHYLTSDLEEGKIEAEEAQFIDEIIESAGRDDIMITKLEVTEE